jgi:hypothetical protein
MFSRIILFGIVFFISMQSSKGMTLEDRVCESWIKSIENKKSEQYKKIKNESNRFKKELLFRALFSKESLISLDTSETTSDITLDKDEISVYSVGLYDHDLPSTSELKESQNKLRVMNKKLYSIIKRTEDVNTCVKALKDKNFNLKLMDELRARITSQSKLIQEINNEKIASIAKKTFKRKRQATVKNATLDQMMKKFKTQEQSILILVLHAAHDGKLYDSDWNFIPKSIFNGLNKNIKTLIIYSCYVDAVKERYGLNKLSLEKNIKVILPKTQESVDYFFQQKIPAVLFKLFIKKALKSAIVSKEKVQMITKDKCTFKVGNRSLLQGILGVYLNQNFIGTINKDSVELNYDCELEKDKNIVSLSALNLFDSVTIDQGIPGLEMTNHQGNHFLLQHTFSEGKYIGSKGLFHIDS